MLHLRLEVADPPVFTATDDGVIGTVRQAECPSPRLKEPAKACLQCALGAQHSHSSRRHPSSCVSNRITPGPLTIKLRSVGAKHFTAIACPQDRNPTLGTL